MFLIILLINFNLGLFNYRKNDKELEKRIEYYNQQNKILCLLLSN